MSVADFISVNAQSSIRLGGEKVLCFDPFRLEVEPHDADVVFVTHAHFDHFSPEDIAKVVKPSTCFVLPESMKKDAKKAGLPAERCVFLKPGDKTEVASVPVEAVPSYNIGKPMHLRHFGWLGYVVTVQGDRIYVSGDMDAIPEAETLSCRVALIPIGGTYTMNPAEAAALVNRMKPEIAIPTHYGSVVGKPEDGQTFAAAVDPAVQVEFRL